MRWFGAWLLIAVGGGCGDESVPGVEDPVPPAASADAGTVVFGLLSDLGAGTEIGALRVIARENGAVVRDEVWTGDDLRFPSEVRTSELPRDARVEVELEVYDATQFRRYLFTRRAATQIPFGHTSLALVRLERECIPGQVVVGDILGPTCAEDRTCIGARCRDPFVRPQTLQPWTADWATPAPDGCKASGGASDVELGVGEDGFTPLGPDGGIRAHGGLQGGFHVFAGLRTRGLFGGAELASIAMADAAGKVEELENMVIFEPLAMGGCAATNVRFILPFESMPGLSSDEKVAAILGRSFHVDVRVLDRMGDLACESRDIVISDVSVDD